MLGLALFAGGFVYEIMFAGPGFQDMQTLSGDEAESALFARKISVTGIAVAFAAIFGGAGWGFYRRLKSTEEPFKKRD